MLDSIDAMIDRQRNNTLSNMSKRTRALYDAFRAAEQEDRERGWRDEDEEGGEEDALPSPDDDTAAPTYRIEISDYRAQPRTKP